MATSGIALHGIKLERDRVTRFCNEKVWRYENITPIRSATPLVAGPASIALSGAQPQGKCPPGPVGHREFPAGSIVPPPRLRKTVVNIRRGSDSRRRPHASQRKSIIVQLLCPLQRHAGVVTAFGPLDHVVYCRSAFGRVIPIRNHVDGPGVSKTAFPSRTRWPPHRELLVALQNHLLNHQPLEYILGRDAFFQTEDRRRQRASCFVLELVPEDEVAAIGQVPPFEYPGPGLLQGLGRRQPIPLAPVRRWGAGPQVPQVAAGPGREGEAVVDIEAALEAVSCPHAVQAGTAPKSHTLNELRVFKATCLAKRTVPLPDILSCTRQVRVHPVHTIRRKGSA